MLAYVVPYCCSLLAVCLLHSYGFCHCFILGCHFQCPHQHVPFWYSQWLATLAHKCQVSPHLHEQDQEEQELLSELATLDAIRSRRISVSSGGVAQ